LASSTRPDIAYAVHHAARFVAKPSYEHVQAVKRILRYIRGTIETGIIFKRDESNVLIGYADADFAGHADDSRSTSGYMFLLNGPISWSSRRQRLTALSTTEAEIYALAEAAKEAVWISNLLKDMTLMSPDASVKMMEDNAACHAIVNGVKAPTRTKHLAVRIGFVRDIIGDKVIAVERCPTTAMLADPLTKALGPIDLERKMQTIVSTTINAKGCARTLKRAKFNPAEGEC
jgi:hypothetical protein